jgi:hypothetical protein
VRSVLDISKPATGDNNGAIKLDVASVESDIERELKYRVAAPSKDDKKLYQSGESMWLITNADGSVASDCSTAQQRRMLHRPCLPTASDSLTCLACSGLERAQPPGGCV